MVKRLSPEPLCISCIGESLEASEQAELALVVFEIVGQSDFMSDRGACSLCNEVRRIVRHRPFMLQR